MEIYEWSPAPYAPPKTRAVVYYRADLAWRDMRVIVCKELCHLLMRAIKACCVASDEELTALLDSLSLSEKAQQLLSATPQMASEHLAQMMALEILCPLRVRKGLLPRYESGQISSEAIANMFGIPVGYVEIIFARGFIETMDAVRKTAIPGAD